MNRIFTLVTMGVLCLASTSSFAQINQDFEQDLPSCWKLETPTVLPGSKLTGIVPNAVNGTKSVQFTNNGTSYLFTPYIKVSSGQQITVEFKYRVSDLLNKKIRTLELGYQDKAGNFTSLTPGKIDVTSTSTTPFTLTANTLPAGSYKIVIKSVADGSNEVVYVDDLKISGTTYHYGDTPCNPNPTANNDFYTLAPGTYASVLVNDTDPNGEVLTAEIVSNSADGNIVLNANGTFTFTPNAGFTGSKTTFTYRVKDNGYDPVYSATNATVTITVPPSPIILPIQLLSFQGSVTNEKAQLTWRVADNETGSYFEVQKSTDGKLFNQVGTVFTTEKSGTDNYSYVDESGIKETAFYRLRTVNKDGSTSLSKILSLKRTGSAADDQIRLLQNPIQNTLTFSYSAAASEIHELNLYNLSGVKVYSQQVMAQKGNNSLSIQIGSRLTAGTYILEVVSPGSRKLAKLVKY